MINQCTSLNNRQQKDIIDLAWFIIYCKSKKLDAPERHNCWKHYSNLVKEINLLFNKH